MNLVELTDTIIKKIVADSESVSVKEFASDNEEVILITKRISILFFNVFTNIRLFCNFNYLML